MTRDEAIDRLKNVAWLGSNEDREATEKAINIAIRSLEAWDEVVRCKDCTRQLICYHSDDYYCADGERREE